MAGAKRIADWAGRFGFRAEAGGARLDWEKRDDWQREARDWRCTLRFEGRRLGLDFWQGQGHTKPPTAAEVLSCVVSDARAGGLSFEEFCSEFGHDADSRKAWRTWRACVRARAKLLALVGSEAEFDALLEAEDD